MKCKGSHYAGSIIAEEVKPAEITANQPKVCGSEDWELVWVNTLREEGPPVNMYQCRTCKRVVMATDYWFNSENWV